MEGEDTLSRSIFGHFQTVIKVEQIRISQHGEQDSPRIVDIYKWKKNLAEYTPRIEMGWGK